MGGCPQNMMGGQFVALPLAFHGGLGDARSSGCPKNVSKNPLYSEEINWKLLAAKVPSVMPLLDHHPAQAVRPAADFGSVLNQWCFRSGFTWE